MDKKIVKFDDTEIEEYEFYKYKSPVSINNKQYCTVFLPKLKI